MSKQLVTSFVILAWCAIATAQDGKSKKPTHPELQQELKQRVKLDQDARFAMIEQSKKPQSEKTDEMKLIEKVSKIDSDNTAWLKGLVDKQGWPTISMVGNDGAQAAWLLVQHADAKPGFQRQCLDLMEKLPKTEIHVKNLAYLTDRVLLAEGKKQRYGTQFTQVNGEWKPRPLENEAEVDKRRAEAGLSTLAEYVKQLEKTYGTKK